MNMSRWDLEDALSIAMDERDGYAADAEELRAELAQARAQMSAVRSHAIAAARDWQSMCDGMRSTLAEVRADAERDLVSFRAELAEREREYARVAAARDEAGSECLLLHHRIRSVAQTLIDEIGAQGPQNADVTALRAVGVIRDLCAKLGKEARKVGHLLARAHSRPTPEDEAANAELRYALQIERSDAAIAKADRLIADLAADDPLLLRLAESITRGKP